MSSGPFTNPLTLRLLRVAVLRVFRGHAVLRPEAHDLLQETVARLLTLPRPHDGPSCVRLAVGIARNVAREQVSLHASRRRYNVGLCADPDAIPATEADPLELSERLQALDHVAVQFRVGDLSATDHAILLAVADDVSHAEIAEELGLRTQTVRNRLCRMRRIVADARSDAQGGRAPQERSPPSR